MLNTSSLKYRNWPIFYKMAVVFSLMVTIIILAIGFVFYQVYRSSMEQQVRELVPQSLLQANRQIESYVKDLKSASQTSLIPPYSKVMSEVLTNIKQSKETPSLETTLKLQEVIDLIKLRIKDRLYGVTFYTVNGDSYVYEQFGGIWIRNRPYSSQDWYSRLDLNNFSPIVIGTIQLPTTAIINDPNPSFVFSIVQPMRLTGTKELAGVLQIFGSLETLSTIMQGINFGTGSSLYIVDQDNKIVYSSSSNQLGEQWNSNQGIDWNRQQVGTASQIIQLNGKKYLASYNWSIETNWKVIGITPIENFSKGISKGRLWTGIGVVIGILVAILLSSMLAYGFTGRLRKLSRQIRSVQIDKLQLKLDTVHLDEIGYLSESFRSMMNHIRNLIEEVLKAKILKQEAEINVLHSQINPHFLYNVLEAIRMTINKGDIAAAESALVSLGWVFRYQIYQVNNHVTIRTEMEFIDKYLQIQKLRFGEQLEVELDIAPDSLDILIPRMIMQPLMENALKHGHSPVDFSVQLTVRIGLDNGSLLIDIIDEGSGMTDERLAEVLLGLEAGFTSDNRFGLANVYQRIKQMYGEGGHMSIQTEEGTGTIVKIRIPAYSSKALQ